MEMIFMNPENSKTNEPHKFALNLSHRSDFRSTNKHASLQNLSFYYIKSITLYQETIKSINSK